MCSTERLTARAAKLEAALKALVDRLDEIAIDPSFMTMQTTFAMYGFKYSGPSWKEPCEAARAALKDPPPGG